MRTILVVFSTKLFYSKAGSLAPSDTSKGILELVFEITFATTFLETNIILFLPKPNPSISTMNTSIAGTAAQDG